MSEWSSPRHSSFDSRTEMGKASENKQDNEMI